MPTPNGGLNQICDAAYRNHPAMTLVAYTNAVGTLGPTSVASDLSVVVTSNGYAPITLTPANWSAAVNGVTQYTSTPVWTATGSWSGTVNGVAIIYNGQIRHFQDFTGVGSIPPPWVASNARRLSVDINQITG